MPPHFSFLRLRNSLRAGTGKFVVSGVIMLTPLVAGATEASAPLGYVALNMGLVSTAAVICLALGAAAILFPWD